MMKAASTGSLLKLVTTAAAVALFAAGCAQQGATEGTSASDVRYGSRVHKMPLQTSATNTSAPSGAHLTYYGGHVISNVKVVQVLWGTGSYLAQVQSTTAPSIASFYQQITNSAQWDWLTEYNTNITAAGGQAGTHQSIGHGSFDRQVTITPSAANNGSTIDDSNIQNELMAQISAGHLPAPTFDSTGANNTYYALFFPHGKSITQGGSASCVQFCAYHGTFTQSGHNLYYGVHPDMQAGSGCESGCGSDPSAFNNYTSVASHELVEATTDAEVGLATANAPPLAWYDSTNGEIGDICNAQQGTIAGTDGHTYVVQKEFSNVANDCIVTRPVTNPNDFSVSASPTSLTISSGSSGSVSVSTAVTSGSAETVSFSVSGLPSGVTGSFSPASVSSGGSSTLTLTASSSAPASTATVTITGTASTGSHTATVSLTVTSTTPPANDFTVALNPTSLTVNAGSSGTTTVSTTTSSGNAQTVTFSASGLPAGVTASFNPASVTSGGSSTLTLTASSSAASATATVTVVGTGSSVSHSKPLSLTVVGGSTGGGTLTNGGFEAGSLSGWTASGASETVVSSGCHGGTYCARLGSTSPTNGDSSIAQTFTAPSNATGLSLYYNETCPDSVTYDWALATLKDNTAGTTANVIVQACATTGWKQATAAMTAGHSYTLTLTSHDDNYSGDATYTLFDDVSISTGSPPPAGGITNGGFETGTLSGWTASGASESVTTVAHSGSYAAWLGSTVPTNGSSSIAQTFTVPNGKTSLSFVWANNCPDSVTYDWFTATLKDNTAGTSRTVVAPTCAATYTWTQSTAQVTAGHSYTLTFTNVDDGYPGDPTYSLVDDVTLN